MSERQGLPPRLKPTMVISAVVLALSGAVLLYFSGRGAQSGLEVALVGIAMVAVFPSTLVLVSGVMSIVMYLRDRRGR